VAMTDENGCPAGDETVVMVDPNRNFYIPNTFTPNGDGRNDLFRIRARINSIRQVNTFQVFDRWGELLFEAKDFRPQEENDSDAWNGSFRGRELPTETFTFYAEVEYLDGEKEIAKGTITLVR
jgi:gliding motility-associated-like protein